MATEKQASMAARKYTTKLKKLGAFAIDVRKAGRSTGFEVQVSFSNALERDLPRVIFVNDGGSKVSVPLRVIVAEQFEPE